MTARDTCGLGRTWRRQATRNSPCARTQHSFRAISDSPNRRPPRRRCHRPRRYLHRRRSCPPLSTTAEWFARKSGTDPLRTDADELARAHPQSTAPANTGWRTRARSNSRCRPSDTRSPSSGSHDGRWRCRVRKRIRACARRSRRHPVACTSAPMHERYGRYQPVDARIRAEIDNDDFSEQGVRRQAWRIEPLVPRPMAVNSRGGRWFAATPPSRAALAVPTVIATLERKRRRS